MTELIGTIKEEVPIKKGVPWELVECFDCETRSEAVQLEMKIKKRGIKRYLEDINRGVVSLRSAINSVRLAHPAYGGRVVGSFENV